VKRRETRVWLARGAIVTVLLVPLLLWLSGCWLFNVAPVAAFTVRATIVEVGESLAFSAILSSDEDGIIAKFEWDFGDGGSATGESVTHTFTATGQYTVVLRVTDNRGATATAQKVITVNPADGDGDGAGGAGPTATFTATPLTGQSPLTVTFNASASTAPGMAITAYFWDFGDGTTGAGITTVHTYGPTTTRTYNVVLRVIAEDNSEDTATKTVTATVAGAAPAEDNPTASFTTNPNEQVAPLEVRFDPSNSEASAGRVLDTYIWNYGDGSENEVKTTDAEVTHRYYTSQAVEEFLVTLRVIDDENNSDTETRTVSINNYQPEAGFEVYYRVNTAEGTVKADANPDHWLADAEIEFTATEGVQTPPNTVWIRSLQVTDLDWTRDPANPTPAVGENGHPDAPVWNSNNYSHDREGQYWAAPGSPFPGGEPCWGLKTLEVDWGDVWEPYAYEPAGNADNIHGHAYNGTGWFTIELTARDHLNGTDTFSRRVRITAD